MEKGPISNQANEDPARRQGGVASTAREPGFAAPQAGADPGARRSAVDPTAPQSAVDPAGPVMEPGLERLGRRMGHSAAWFLAISVPFVAAGLILVLAVDSAWSLAFGVLCFLLASIPAGVGVALLISGVVSRWAARHRSFA